MIVDVKKVKKCAFCKHWYDPTNSAIEPQCASSNLWKFDNSAKCKCLKSNLTMSGGAFCRNYVCKIDLN